MNNAVDSLPAKFDTPQRAHHSLLRERLVDALHAHVECKLQLVIAPPGFGKTTLLADFCRDAAFVTYWATLERDDRDLVAFVETVVGALRHRLPGFGGRTLSELRRPVPVESRVGALARTLAAEVAEQVEPLAVLVLDDYHEVNESSAVTQLLDELLRLLPDNLRLVLVGRALPALTVSRLIVENQVFGLGEADLRFTTGELTTLLSRRAGPRLAPEQAAALAEGAEGWIAGFLLSVPGLWDGLIGGLIADRGGEGPLYQYLAAEAFDRQPAEVQRFLLATSVPATMDSELCASLLPPGPWPALLDRVEQAGLFVSRLRGGPLAFRYHQLFREFLQTRLRRYAPHEYARLHAAAGNCLAVRGAWSPALTHLLAAGDDAGAGVLLERVAPQLQQSGRLRSLIDALASLPAAAAADHLELLLAGARAALVAADFAHADQFTEAAHAAARAAGNSAGEAWTLAYLGNVRRLQGHTREALELLARATELAPDDQALAATVQRESGQCHVVRGDFGAAVQEMRPALAYFDRAGQEYEAARTEFGLGVALAKAGRLGEAVAHYEAARDRWRHLGDPSMEAEMLNCLGCAHAYRGDYDQARAALHACLEQARREGYALTAAAALHSLADVSLAAGDPDAARLAAEQGLAVAKDLGELWVTTHLYDALALATALGGDLRRAEEHAHHAIALAQRQDSRYLVALCSLTLGAIGTHTGQPEATASLLESVGTLAELEAERELARGYAWLAQAYERAGATAESRRYLLQVLQLAVKLGSDSVLDVPARWDPSPLVSAQRDGVEPARLAAVLARAGRSAVLAPALAMSPALPPLPALDVRAFGTGTVTLDGARDVAWPWEKARELFFLLLQGGPLRHEQLTAALWPELPPERTRAGLHTAVYRLRKAVHPRVLALRGGVYRIDEELVVRYDVREFERQLRQAEDAALSPGGRAVLLQGAVDLYSAAFLVDLDATWCVRERERLERLLLLALERLSDVYAAAGRPRESVAVAERLVAVDPLREEAHARVIHAYLRLGDRAAARRQFERCAALLQEELGVAPGEGLQTLARRLGA